MVVHMVIMTCLEGRLTVIDMRRGAERRRKLRPKLPVRVCCNAFAGLWRGNCAISCLVFSVIHRLQEHSQGSSLFYTR